jgi:hypothetical protein
LAELKNLTLGVLQVAEGNGPGRTGLAAGCDVFSILEVAPLFHQGLIFDPLIAMVAEGAFIDHTAHGQGNIRI